MQEFSTHLIESIQARLNPKLADFYNKNSQRSKSYSESYTELIREILEKECDNKDSKSMSKLETSKRHSRAGKRRRYYKKCQDMLDAKMWEATDIDAFFCRDIVLSYNFLTNTEKLDRVYGDETIENLCYEKLDEVRKWASDNNSLMIDYPGTERKTPKAMYSNFIVDLTIDILRVINENFSGDLASKTASYVDNVSENVLFGIASERIPINRNGPTEVMIYKNEEHTSWIKIIYNGIDDEEDYVTLFDTKDFDIAAYITTRLMQAPPTQRAALIRKLDIVRVYIGGSNRRPSKSDYNAVTKRMKKLATMQFICSNFGNAEWGAFRLIGDIFEKKIGGEDYYECHSSGYIEEQIENGMILRMPTDPEDNVNNAAAKLLRPLFMKQRIRIYRMIASGQKENGPYTAMYKHHDFMAYVNFGDGNRKDGRDAICRALDAYMKSGKMIKDYSYSRITDTYKITFYELSETEIKDIDFILYKNGASRLSDNIIGQVLLSDLMPT